MALGFSAVKAMYLDRIADAFAAAGLASVVFDNRNFGASDGEPGKTFRYLGVPKLARKHSAAR
jgi:hypothetical protein